MSLSILASGWRALSLLLITLISVSTIALAAPQKYGAKVSYTLGQPIVFPDLEVTANGGGSDLEKGKLREYLAFQVWSKGKTMLVLWYLPQPGKVGAPVDFQIAGQGYKFQRLEPTNPRTDGLLIITKKGR